MLGTEVDHLPHAELSGNHPQVKSISIRITSSHEAQVTIIASYPGMWLAQTLPLRVAGLVPRPDQHLCDSQILGNACAWTVDLVFIEMKC